jgi:CRP-like cAMP-binding protein
MAIDADLGSLALFAGCEPDALRLLAQSFDAQHRRAGEVVMAQDEVGTTFVVVLGGEVEVARRDGNGTAGESKVIAHAGRGSVLGELAMLTGRPRRATITAVTDVELAVGDHRVFDALLATPGVLERMIAIAAQRLAANVAPVPVVLRDGTPVVLRPLLPSDRAKFAAVLEHQSAESLRRRFFTTVEVSDRIVDYLVNIDYVDHFAWGVAPPDESSSIGAARYVRLHDEHAAADLAFDVADEYRGRGLATLLLGALGVAAQRAGITTLVADVLYENAPMIAVLEKAGAQGEHSEPGVAHFTVDAAAAIALLDEPLRAQLGRAAAEVVTAAGLALTDLA